ncbi:hypothetical protein [Olleya sp. Bg11-27]|uniref:hypothetical protein n=1 Tax=Olleya sp. Bg11-27 TaxID=2058135 RepID=UPI000C2FF4AE|nr:hypothetical protein [Olleya sp. Bg11-27]AUC74780.1 hypothetical protein CW732_03440 [Olleya sp. Bg11-27]
MRFFKYISVSILSSFFFMQCSSAQKLQENASFETSPVYFQKWVAGVKGGGSGINVFIPITTELKDINLDSLYFRGNMVALQTKPSSPKLYIGRIIGNANQKEGYKSTGDKIPFDLKDNEAVVSYSEKGKIKYFKIENITEKPMEQFPSAPPRKAKMKE